MDTPLAYVSQTTLSVDETKGVIKALQNKFSNLTGPKTSDICYATQHRQTSVRDLCKVCDVIIVVGAPNSSNSNRLREIGEEEGIPSYLIADASAIDPSWLAGKQVVGLTAGASAPEALVQGVIAALREIDDGRGLHHGRHRRKTLNSGFAGGLARRRDRHKFVA